jgi:multiple sugar transport system substrate-binding protein
MNPKKIASLTALGALVLAACAAPPTAQPAAQQPAQQQPAKKFAGITVNAITFSGPQIAEPMQRRGKEFSELTGATINVVTVPFADLY